MNSKRFASSGVKWLAAGIGLSAASYVAYAGATWLRYGKPRPANGENADRVLDIFMPVYDVVDRHAVHVDAPADVTYSAATQIDLQNCAIVRGIFKAREVMLRSKPVDANRPRGIVAETKSLGWGVLSESAGREIVMGAVTKPWDANPVFVALPPDEFAVFEEPGYVKIVWTLRADSDGTDQSVFRTETRALATDVEARRKFRWYWSFLSPGIVIIRVAMLPAVKAEAERMWRQLAA
jgi:hypothetical protein